MDPAANSLENLEHDRCQSFTPLCHHTCINTRDSYLCACHPGYTLLLDGRTCEPGKISSSVSSDDSVYNKNPGTCFLLYIDTVLYALTIFKLSRCSSMKCPIWISIKVVENEFVIHRFSQQRSASVYNIANASLILMHSKHTLSVLH